jgi:hypothetical protein
MHGYKQPLVLEDVKIPEIAANREFVPVRYDYIIRVAKKYNLQAEELAPLTDAGLTPFFQRA